MVHLGPAGLPEGLDAPIGLGPDPTVFQEHGRAQGPGQGEMFRNENLVPGDAQDIRQGPDHPDVGGHPAHQGQGNLEGLHAQDGGFESPDQGLAEPGHDIVQGRAFLL